MSISETSSISSQESWDGWEEVYTIEEFEARHLECNGGTYYQTYGGGPEGGYVVKNDDVYAVNREWLERWTAKKLINSTLIFNYSRSTLCKVIDN